MNILRRRKFPVSLRSLEAITKRIQKDHLIFYAVSNLAVAPHIDGRCADHKGPRVIWEFSAT